MFAAWLLYSAYQENPGFTADFGQWHLAARTVLNSEDPYLTNGPGLKYQWPWPFMYPATVIFPVIPLAWLPEVAAGMVFTGVCTFVMIMAITRTSLHLLPLVASIPFQMSAGLGQWSLLATAAVFYPALAFIFAIKPQAGIPVLLAARTSRAVLVAVGIGIMLFAASIILLPNWINDWLRILRDGANNERYIPPVLSYGGLILPLVLLRWRLRESWLLLGMSILPQSLSYYFLLPLYTIPRSLGESVCLVGFSTAVFLLAPPGENFFQWSSDLAVVGVYLPCLFMILLRNGNPNTLRSK